MKQPSNTRVGTLLPGSGASLSGLGRLGVYCALTFIALFVDFPIAAQTFRNPSFISTGSDPSTISVGDFNGDGKPDLVYVDGGISGPAFLHILLGTGSGAFNRKQDVQLPSGIGGIVTVADVNKDGKLDLVLGCDSAQAQVAVLLGNGDGSFQSPILSQFPAGGLNFAVVKGAIGVADFNGDGAADLAVSDILNNAVYILTGDNTGTFTLKTTIFNGAGPSKILTGDFNGDGHMDILVEGVLGANVTVYLGKGDGTFQAGVSYTGPHNVTGVVLRDMDGDGHPDLVVSGFNDTIDILHGNADGTFATTSSGGSPNAGPLATLLAVFDFNSDGVLDIATATDNGISILLGKGNLSYGAPVAYSGSTSPASAVMADFNGDGHEDFAEIAPGGIAVIFGAPGGTLQGADMYDLGEALNAVTVADFNGDNNPDIAVNAAEPTPRLLIGNGGGKFTVQPSSSAGTTAIPGVFIHTGDFNGDSRADLVVTGGSTPGTVFFGNGNGTFGPPVALSIFGQVGGGQIAIGDFNHDGTSDIAALDYQALDILLGQKNNTFKDLNNPFSLLVPGGGAAIADFNKDGNLDLVVSQDEANPLQVLLGNGDGTFKIGSQLRTINLPQVLATADFDGDGNTDIVACLGFFNLAQIFYGNGDGTFQDPVNIQLQRSYTQVAVADIDGDGKPDLIFSDGSVLAVVRNVGNRTFGAEEHFLAGYIASFVVKDVNGDGLPDIIVANGNTGNGGSPTTVTVLLNQGLGNTVTGQLVASPDPDTYAQPFTIALALKSAGSNVPAPSGTVAITIDDSPVATIPVTGPNLTYVDPNSPPLIVGTHSIVAAYSGDSNYLAGSFTAQIQIVPIVYPTTTTLAATPSSVLAGQTIRFTASVTSPGQNANAPNPLSGMVVFRDGATNLGTAILNANQTATFDTSLLTIGSHNITAMYLGYTATFEQTASFAPSSSPFVIVSVGSNSTATSLTANPTSTQVGSVVSLTSVVSSGAGTPTGAVTFSDGNIVLAVQPLDGKGTAVFNTAFGSAGTHLLSAVYQANSSFASSTSQVLSLMVSASAQGNQSATSLKAVQNSSAMDAITLSTKVSGSDGIPSGQVIFWDGAVRLGNLNLSGEGAAVLTVSSLGAGVHYFSAIYSGSALLRPSASPVLVERVPFNDPDFSLNMSSSSLTVPQGQSTSVAVTVNPINGFNHRVSLSCQVDTPGISCQFARAILPNGEGTTVLTINTLRSQSATWFMAGRRIDLQLTFLGMLLLSSIALLASRPVGRSFSFIMALLICAVAAAGCGTSRSGAMSALTPLGNHPVSVVASYDNSNGQASHSAWIMIMVESPPN